MDSSVLLGVVGGVTFSRDARLLLQEKKCNMETVNTLALIGKTTCGDYFKIHCYRHTDSISTYACKCKCTLVQCIGRLLK